MLTLFLRAGNLKLQKRNEVKKNGFKALESGAMARQAIASLSIKNKKRNFKSFSRFKHWTQRKSMDRLKRKKLSSEQPTEGSTQLSFHPS